jgi:opacity protein-like surface antigen
VKKFALCIALAAGLSGTAQAALVEFERTTVNAAPIAGFASRGDLMVASGAVAAPGQMSELPEPEVFAMMLLGLVLIGWRASRHSDEKFE